MQAAGGAALSPEPVGSRRRAIGVLAGLAATAVLLDLLSKQLAQAHLAGDTEPVRLLGGLIYLVYTTNSGAAFSLGGSYTAIFSVIAIGVLVWIAWMAARLRSRPWAIALGLVAGGAGGNLIDRLFRSPAPFRGEVVDMISVFSPTGSVWPVFNLADSALVVGVALAVWLELTGRRRDGTRMSRRENPITQADSA